MQLIGLSTTSRTVLEKEIQEVFERDYDKLEPGLKHVGSFIATTVGIMDSLALDDEGNPVIVEFKREGGSSYEALIQAMDYAVWCSESSSWLEKTVLTLGHTKPITDNIRIIVVAAAFDERIKRAARGVEFDVQLISYAMHEDSETTLLVPRIEIDTAGTLSTKETQPPKSKEQHLKKLSDPLADLYTKYEDALKKLPNVTVNYQPQNYIGFQFKRQNFVAVFPKREWIRLDFRLTSEEARTPGFVEMSGGWGYFHLKPATFDEAMQITETVYKKMSEGG